MNPTQECWLPVPGYEGYYEVSDHGRVRSLDRTVIRSDGVVQRRRGKMLSPARNQSGHRMVALLRDGKRTTGLVHRLVLSAFVGACPDGMQGCHWDDNPANNSLKNLRWGTPSDNMHDRVRNGRHYQAVKGHCHLGHAFTGENTYVKPNGTRACRICLRRRDKELYDRSHARRNRRKRC